LSDSRTWTKREKKSPAEGYCGKYLDKGSPHVGSKGPVHARRKPREEKKGKRKRELEGGKELKSIKDRGTLSVLKRDQSRDPGN